MAFGYITVKQAAIKWSITTRRVQQLCMSGRIEGALRPERDWLIPKNAEKPKDTRGEWHKRNEGG